MATAALSDAQTILLDQAKATHLAAKGKAYKYAGNDVDGFDCSGFVIYVFNAAFKNDQLQRVTAEALRTGGRFAKTTTAAPGDLVFFSAKKGGSTASHVAIVMSDTEFLGSQSSTGVAYVKFSNTYWNPLILAYGRFDKMTSATAIIPSRAGEFASPIR